MNIVCMLLNHKWKYGGDGHRGLFPWWKCARCGATKNESRSREQARIDGYIEDEE